jgi:ElaA protein
MIHWTWKTFLSLSLGELYGILRLRQEVFIVEQQSIYLDADGKDEHSLHLMGCDDAGTLVAYLRLVPPGLRFAEPSIGRVITSRTVRGSGAGKLLMAEGLQKARMQYPGEANRISAQLYLERFYAGFGYVRVGDPYVEDGILHVEMVCDLPPRVRSDTANRTVPPRTDR